MSTNPEEQYAGEVEAMAAEVEAKHAEELGKLRTTIDEQANTISTLKTQVEDAEAKGWTAALAAMKRRLLRS